MERLRQRFDRGSEHVRILSVPGIVFGRPVVVRVPTFGDMDFTSRLRDLPDLRTPRLILRRLTLDDIEPMFDYARLPRTSAFCSWEYHRSIADTRAFLEFWVSGYGTDSVRDWAVVEMDSGRMVGTGGFAQFDPATGAAEIGYVLHPDVWGRGYATELVAAVVDWGFASPDLDKVFARCLVANRASALVLEKNRFHRDGTLRAAFRKQGVAVDVHQYSLLRQDREGPRIEVDSDVSDRERVEEITLHAFQYDPETGKAIAGVEPTELPLVRDMYDQGAILRGHALRLDGTMVGYVLYASCEHLCQRDLRVASLLIMGVHPLAQREGLGTRLLTESVQDMRGRCDLLVVLGHPGFYPRAGFVPMSDLGLAFPGDLPKEACMALNLSGREVLPGVVGFPGVLAGHFP